MKGKGEMEHQESMRLKYHSQESRNLSHFLSIYNKSYCSSPLLSKIYPRKNSKSILCGTDEQMARGSRLYEVEDTVQHNTNAYVGSKSSSS